MLELRGFSYRYPGQARHALLDLTLEIPRGQFCAVVGANGAGKSTLCYALSGFAPHFFGGKTRGSLHLDGQDVLAASLGQLAGQVGLVFQNPFNQISGARFTVRDEIAFGLENLGLPRRTIAQRVKELLEQMDLASLAGRSPLELSGGQQQRVALAAVLAMRPKLLVLDEPTAQLDPHSSEAVFEMLSRIARQEHTTLVLVEHKLELVAAYAQRVLLMDKGRIVMDGGPEALLAHPDLERLGVGRTAYTQAAQLARERKLTPSAKLPVTLAQARRYFP